MESRTLNKNVKEAGIGDVYQKRGGRRKAACRERA
jgi:hypothetical protein